MTKLLTNCGLSERISKYDLIKAFISKLFCLLSYSMLMKDFALVASRSGLTSSMKVDGRKDIHSVISAWSILYPEFTAHSLFPQVGNDKGRKTNTHTQKELLLISFKKVFHEKTESVPLLYLLSTLCICQLYCMPILKDFHCVSLHCIIAVVTFTTKEL